MILVKRHTHSNSLHTMPHETGDAGNGEIPELGECQGIPDVRLGVG